ncbi:hypothetical protein GCM10023189_30810 [Nibrella saemangeumensis]|uniref:Thioredoxin domain-containing protein n=1 Tax=Nibrella saemangeumensis TaxID=1084526 RepID=A0ABP8MZ34_9BACT
MKLAVAIVLLGFGLTTPTTAQSVQVVKFDTLQQLLNRPTDTTYVINFWATWCKPCVSELQHFEQLSQDVQLQNVKVLLVSMDFAKDLVNRVQPFLLRKEITVPVWLLDDTNYNSWIDRIDDSWTGAIPATLMINPLTRKKKFFEQEFTYEALYDEVSEFD